jgi:uncharacterized protein
MPSRDEIRALLQAARTIAVVGLSADPDRPSYGVASYLQREGYTIIPVNPKLVEPVLGEEPFGSLAEIGVPVDIVQIFRRSQFVPPVVEAAIAIGARAIWMQLGVVHAEAAERARAAGLQVVMDRCMAVDHRMLLG